MHPQSNLRIHPHRRKDVHFLYVDHIFSVQNAQMCRQTKSGGKLGDIRSGFRLQLQTIDIAADCVDQLQSDLIAALIRLGEVAPLKQRLDDAISCALMQADLVCDFRQSHRTPRFCHCFDDIQRSVDRLYSLIFCHRLPPAFLFLSYTVTHKLKK